MLRSTLCHRIIRIHPARSSICSYSVCASILSVFHDIHGLNACNVSAIIDLFLLMHMHMHMLIFGSLSYAYASTENISVIAFTLYAFDLYDIFV